MKREVSPLKRHIEESPKLRALRDKRRKRRMRVCILLGILLLLLIGTFIYVSHLPRIQLTLVIVSGNKVVDTDEIISHVEQKLEGKYAYVIPHRMAFLYPKEEIVADLVASFPRFKSVAVYRANHTTLQVTVEEVRGRALWCGTNIHAENAPCYFTDESGKIVSEAPQYSGNVYPRFFGGTLVSGTDPLGKVFIDEVTFGNLLAFFERVQVLGFQVKAVEIGEADEDTFLLDLGNSAAAPLRFQKDDDFVMLAGNLAAAIGNPELAKSLKTDKANLEYFDLRFTNKVYYKFSDGK